MKYKKIYALSMLAGLLLTGCNFAQNGKNPDTKEDSQGDVEPPIHEHEFGLWQIETLPTDTTEGKAKRTCSCNAKEEKVLPVLTDSRYVKGNDTATCTEAGKIHYSITMDGNVIEFNIDTTALEHSYGDWQIETLPTDTTEGKAKRTCSCNAKEEKVLPKLTDSRYVKGSDSATCTKGGKMHYSITLESRLFEFDIDTSALEHDYKVNEEETKYASYLYGGNKVEVCEKCSNKKQTPISQLTTTDTLGVLSNDYSVTLSGKNVTNGEGENKITDGLFVIGSKDHAITAQINDGGSNKDRIFLGDGINADSRLILINVASSCTVTVTMGAKSSGTDVTLALFDKNGDLNARKDYIEGQFATTKSASNMDHEFIIPEAGLYALGSLGGSIKISNMVFEFHTIDDTIWANNETQHWHPSNGEGCSLASEKEDHTFGEPKVITPAQVGVEGLQAYTCDVCKYEKQEVIPAISEVSYNFDNTHHWIGEDESTKEAHTDGEMTVVKKPSYFEDGLGKATCSVCNKEHDVVLPKLEIEEFGAITENFEITLNADNVTNKTGVNKNSNGFAVIGSEENPLTTESKAAGDKYDRIYLVTVLNESGNMLLINLAKESSVSVTFGSKSKAESNIGVFNVTPNADRSNHIKTGSAPSSSNVTKVFDLQPGLYAIGSIGGTENNVKLSNIVITVK